MIAGYQKLHVAPAEIWHDAAGSPQTSRSTVDGTIALDAVRERKPRFVPARVIAEYAALLKSYGIAEVWGDNHAGGYHSSEWTEHGITFRPFKTTTSENYIRALQMFLAKRVRLLDNATLREQLISLERTPGAGDRENVTHPKYAHDDVATAVCGAIVAAMEAARLAALQAVPLHAFAFGTPRYYPGSDTSKIAFDRPCFQGGQRRPGDSVEKDGSLRVVYAAGGLASYRLCQRETSLRTWHRPIRA